jgi:hypothetical protein
VLKVLKSEEVYDKEGFAVRTLDVAFDREGWWELGGGRIPPATQLGYK